MNKIRLNIWLVLSIALVGILLGMAASFVYSLSLQIPDLYELENIEQAEATSIYSMDSLCIAEFSNEKRLLADFREIPKPLIQAVISIEDRRFYHHWGIDLIRFTKAIFVNLSSMSMAEGASTITQQLARNLFLNQKKDVKRKIREMLTAIQIERYYSKDEILQMYLNHIYMGPGIWGAKKATQYYFDKPLSRLTLAEAALLAAVIRSPGDYNPARYQGRILKRRNMVLYLMFQNRFINQLSLKQALNEPLPTMISSRKSKIGPYYVEHARRFVLNQFGYDNLYKGGLRVNLTMNSQYQFWADSIINYSLNLLQKKLTPNMDLDLLSDVGIDALPDSLKAEVIQAACVVVEISTGRVLAMVGGRDFSYSELNRALQAQRQPGSSFKPFLYAAAIDQGFTPASLILDQPLAVSISENELWVPQNYDRQTGGFMTLRNGLKLSKNLIAIRLIGKVLPSAVISFAQLVGIQSPLKPYASLAVGTSEVNLGELVAAYIPFATNGYRLDPIYISSITDRNGNLVYSNPLPSRKKLCIRPGVAYLVNSMLQDVVNHGTAFSIRSNGFNFPALAGKTGTTNDYTDAWFVGYSPYIVCGIWVGKDNNSSLGRGMTGSDAAVPIWTRLMKRIHQDYKSVSFIIPDSIVQKNVCKESHLIARPDCPSVYSEYFLISNIPTPCNVQHNQPAKQKRNINDFDLNTN